MHCKPEYDTEPLCINSLPVGTGVPAFPVSAYIGIALPWYGVMVACPSECIALPGREEVAPACAPNCLHALKFGQI